jgi:uncharacterized protein (DUF342 family)
VPVIYQENKIKVWKLKELQTKEKYIEILKGKVPRGEIQDVETEWERFKGSLVEAAAEVCGRKKGKKKHKETPWWTDGIKEAVKKKNKAWREWFKDTTDEKREKWKRLDKAATSMIKFEQKKSWEKFILDLEENYKENKKTIVCSHEEQDKTKIRD